MKLKCKSSDVYTSVLQLLHNAALFLWESNAFGVIMAVIAVISFQFPKKDFFDVLQHINIMRYSLHFFRCI